MKFVSLFFWTERTPNTIDSHCQWSWLCCLPHEKSCLGNQSKRSIFKSCYVAMHLKKDFLFSAKRLKPLLKAILMVENCDSYVAFWELPIYFELRCLFESHLTSTFKPALLSRQRKRPRCVMMSSVDFSSGKATATKLRGTQWKV